MTTKEQRSIRLICLPFSGGSGYAFQPLAKYYPASWEITTLIYPGRGQRIREALLYNMEDFLEDSWQQIKDLLHEPYVFFGHSLGSTLAYLLTHKARAEGYPLPLHLILSGTEGPSVPTETPYRYLLSKADFKTKLTNYGGMSDEILDEAAVFDFFEPIIRADFQVIETWQYQEQPKLSIPTTIITGTEEDMTQAEIQLWQKEFNNPIRFRQMSGNHFFLFEQPKAFVEIMKQELDGIS